MKISLCSPACASLALALLFLSPTASEGQVREASRDSLIDARKADWSQGFEEHRRKVRAVATPAPGVVEKKQVAVQTRTLNAGFQPLVADSFYVNTAFDDPDTNPGDGICDTGFLLIDGITRECTLRAAIQEANASPGPEQVRIRLDIRSPTRDGYLRGYDATNDLWTIYVDSLYAGNRFGVLPTITRSVLIDGLTQLAGDNSGSFSNAQCGNLIANNAHTLKVALDGIMLAPAQDGINVQAGGVRVRGLVVKNFAGVGIRAFNANDFTVDCSYVGTDHAGTTAEPNQWGVLIEESGPTWVTRSLVSGNSTGIVIMNPPGGPPTSNGISTSIVGANAQISAAVPNVVGIEIEEEVDATIAENYISGNTTGILSNCDLELDIHSNFIGTDYIVSSAIGNTTGISITSLASGHHRIGSVAGGLTNIISGNALAGIESWADDLNATVEIGGNWIGTNLAGTGAIPNGDGIHAYGRNHVIGGSTPVLRNVISGNGRGVDVGGVGNVVEGNYIGIDAWGNSQLPNDTGVFVQGITARIGDASAGAPNVISGNTNYGIDIWTSATVTKVDGNVIGLNPLENTSIPNLVGIRDLGTGTVIGGHPPTISNWISGNTNAGIDLAGSSATVRNNGIGVSSIQALPISNGTGIRVAGGTQQIGVPSEGNIIAGSVTDGVRVESGQAAIIGNAIHSNGLLGIDLSGDGVTPNDVGPPHDTDSGPNNLQNFPVISVADVSSGDLYIEYQLSSTPSTEFWIEFFVSPTPDPTFHGEGNTLVADRIVTTDPTGYFSSFINTGGYYPGYWLTATTTPWAPGPAFGPTSEFSAAVRIGPILTLQNGKVFLEGPFQGAMMQTTLADNGVVPFQQPYDDPLFLGTLLFYNDIVSVSDIPPRAVDWVLLSLRSGPDAASEVQRKVGFVREDGILLDVNGNSDIEFVGVNLGSYYLVVCHRNHACAMSDVPVDFTTGTGTFDFTTYPGYTAGPSAQKIVATGPTTYGLFAANANGDRSVQSVDFDVYLAAVQSSGLPYDPADFDMDGVVSSFDFDLYVANTASGASSQVPE